MEPSVVVSFFTQQQRVAREPATTYAGHAAYAVPSYRNTRGVVGVGAAVCAARCLGSRAARSSIPAQRAAATTSRVVLQVEASREDEVSNLVEGWMVKYSLEEPSADGFQYGLAAVVNKGEQLQPLCTWEVGERTFVDNNDIEPVDASCTVAVYDEVWTSCRQLPYDVNPHGEHAEPTYTLLDEEEELLDVLIPIQPDRAPRLV
mmetsp:Transcript_37246/g.84100  ORF Transcript_37246/g.84100 Transcript_37246/m.84100 type:complete len:204 (-) Transcript_37246:69-680(-)